MQPSQIQTGLPHRHHGLLISLIVVSVLFVGAAVFGVWAFSGRQDYKNNVDQKISAALQQNTTAVQARDAANYAQEAKNPLKTFTGPQAYGSIVIKYPKTWSGYVDTTANSGTPVNGYFQPDYVPGTESGSGNVFALRLQVTQQSYDQIVGNYTSQVQQGMVKVAPYKPANVSGVVGVEVTGEIEQNIQGLMIILPLRADTLELWTEASQYESDFNKIILPNFSFSP